MIVISSNLAGLSCASSLESLQTLIAFRADQEEEQSFEGKRAPGSERNVDSYERKSARI
jgi:hypothetical protein